MEEASENAQFMAGSTIPHQIKSLQLQVINYMLEQTVTQKDALLSKLQDEVDTYKFIMKMMQANNNKALTKYEALKEKQNMLEKELRAKSEKIQNLEKKLNAIKQRIKSKEEEALQTKAMEDEESEGQVGVRECI